jgi:chitinase
VGLTEPHGNNVTVSYRTANGSAIAGSDYDSTSGKVTFAKGEISKTILVPVRGDRVAEWDEYFTVQLSNPKGAKIAQGTAYVTIADDEPHISTYDVWGSEGNAGTTPFTFTVWLSQPYDLPVTVNYTTSDGTASAGSDYTATAGTLTFAPGETSKSITVAVSGDRLQEPNESFLFSLSTAHTFAAITQGTANGGIGNDEPQISIADAYNYGETSFTFIVSLAAAYQVVSVDFATVDGAAIAGEDYVALFGTLTFNPGETTKQITVEVIGDVTSWGD